MEQNVLIVVAHADDEVLGCGGTIAKRVASGDAVQLLILADGVSSRPDAVSSDAVLRSEAAEVAAKILGIHNTVRLDMPDNSLDSLPLLQVVRAIENVIQKIKPNIIYTHHYGDLNIDHRVTHQAVMTACRPLPGTCIKEIYTFEALSSTEWNSPFVHPFIPQLFVDITDYVHTKMTALNAYSSEMRLAPHSRSFEHIHALALHRGHSAGLTAAEAFMVMRMTQ